MRNVLPRLIAIAAIAAAALLTTAPALAAEQPGASARATANAINDCAQDHTKCPATPTPQPTSTPAPTATALVFVAAPTVVAPPAATATPVPDLPALSGVDWPDDNIAGYVRPVDDAAFADWLELALPQGRWYVHLNGNCYSSHFLAGAWADVAFSAQPTDHVLRDRGWMVTTGERDGAWACSASQTMWHSAVPCATDTYGTCSAIADPANPAGDAQPSDEPPNLLYVPVPEPLPPPPPAPVAAPAAAPSVQYVYVTLPTPEPVVVYVRDEPAIATPEPTSAPTAGPTPSPEATEEAVVAEPLLSELPDEASLSLDWQLASAYGPFDPLPDETPPFGPPPPPPLNLPFREAVASWEWGILAIARRGVTL